LERPFDVPGVRGESLRRALPDLVRQLLSRVRAAARRLEEAVERIVVDPLVGGREAVADEASELRRRDRSELELLRAPPEGLVLVAEDAVEDVAPAPEVDVRNVRLRLEHRPQEIRVVRAQLDDLLE